MSQKSRHAPSVLILTVVHVCEMAETALTRVTTYNRYKCRLALQLPFIWKLAKIAERSLHFYCQVRTKIPGDLRFCYTKAIIVLNPIWCYSLRLKCWDRFTELWSHTVLLEVDNKKARVHQEQMTPLQSGTVFKGCRWNGKKANTASELFCLAFLAFDHPPCM